MQILISAIIVLLYTSSLPALADKLDMLPEQWQQKLEPVIQVAIASLKQDEQEAINTIRANVNALLQENEVEADELASAYGKLGNLYLIHSLYTSADACYNNAIQLQPDYFPWAYYSAYLAQTDGNMMAARTRLEKAISLDPEYTPASYRLAQVHLELNNTEKAYALYRSLLKVSGYEAAANNGLGQVYMSRQEYPNAIGHFEKALELEPDANQIHYPLALALRATGNTDQAKQHLKLFGKQEIEIDDRLVESLQALRNPASRHFINAMTAVIRKDYIKSAEEFEAGFEYETENTSARTSYARVLYLGGDKAGARTQLEHVMAQDPDKTLAIFLLALLDAESGHNDQALKLYKRVIALEPEHEGANFYLGNYYLHQKNYQAAINHYQLVINSNEKNIPALTFKLVAMMGNNSSDKQLLAAANAILQRAPGMVSVQRIRILLLALSDDTEVRNSKQAAKLAKQLYDRNKYPVNLELIALSTASEGDFNKATAQLRKARDAEKKYSNSPNQNRINSNVKLLEQARLPVLDWQEELKYMLPPPANPVVSFRDYPDANPI